jgi:uncharacterized protein
MTDSPTRRKRIPDSLNSVTVRHRLNLERFKEGVVWMSKFVVKKTSTGYKFDLLANNGEPIASSQIYESQESCLKGIESVRKNAPVAGCVNLLDEHVKPAPNPKFEMYRDTSEEFRFRLKARNGQTIAASEGYASKAGCLNGIESVRKNSADARIETVH